MTHQLPPEVRALTEDDIYRTSSQFRVWSFSPESLAARRTKTHEIAIERIERQRNNGANNALDDGQNNGEKLDYLTEHEELRLVQKYCDMIRATNDNLSWPANVKVRDSHVTLHDTLRLTLTPGDRHPIPAPLLPLQFPFDIPAQRNLQNRTIPRKQSRVQRLPCLQIRSAYLRQT